MTVYEIGAGISPVTDPAIGNRMQGFADKDQKVGGVDSALFSRAFVIVDPASGRRVTIAIADIWSCTQAIKAEVVARLGQSLGRRYHMANVLICGTHTHSAPGRYSHYELYNSAFLDPNNGFDAHTFECIVSGIVDSIEMAHGNLGPGKIFFNKGPINGCGSQRSAAAYNNNPGSEKAFHGRDTDNEMLLLKFVRIDESVGTNARAIGALSWYAIHPTDLGQENSKISGDNKGFAAELFEIDPDIRKLRDSRLTPTFKETFVAAFANSNCGDVSGNVDFGQIPNGVDDRDHMEHHGRQQYEAAKQLFEGASHELSGTVNFRYSIVDMEKSTGCKAALGVSMMAGSTEDGDAGTGLSEGITAKDTAAIRALFQRNTAAIRPVLRWFGVPVGLSMTEAELNRHLPKPVFLAPGVAKPPMVPRILPMQLLTIGHLAIAGIPAELSTMAGRRLRETILEVLRPDIVDCALTTYANGYSQYVTTREEYQMQHYEGASTLFGPGTLEAYQSAFQELAEEMSSPTHSVTKPLPNLSGRAKSIRRVTFRNQKSTAHKVEMWSRQTAGMLEGLVRVVDSFTVGAGEDMVYMMRDNVETRNLSRTGSLKFRAGDLVVIKDGARTYEVQGYEPPPKRERGERSNLARTSLPTARVHIPPRKLSTDEPEKLPETTEWLRPVLHIMMN